uniref:GBF-interacting protein 1 N-terminal domain-containing protein n=1 Tax=Leersia perrieri TaxID=77586 RepID=A0A0D9V3U2_9ORYZ
MSGGGGSGGGGGRGAAAAAGPVPASARKLVQGLKEIVNRPDAEIYAALRDCGMDPDEAVSRLLSQDTFQEVKSKRDKKKEINKETLEPKSRGAANSNNRAIRGGADRTARSSSVQSVSSGTDNMSSRSSILGPGMPTTNSTQKQAVPNTSVNKDVLPDGSLGAMQSSSGFQSNWCGVPGQMSMADIVKMGRPQVRSSSKPVATLDKAYASQTSSFSSVVNQNPNKYPSTVVPTAFEQRFPVLQDPTLQVTNSSHACDDNHERKESDWFQQNGTLSGSQFTVAEASRDISLPVATLESSMLVADDASSHNNSHVGQNSSAIPSDRHLEVHEDSSQFNDDILHNSSSYQSQGNNYDEDDEEVEVSNVDVESASANIQHLSLQTEDLVATKSAEDNPAVIIPDHLQVENGDCGHLSFGSFGSGAFSGLLPSTSHKNNVEEVPIPDESPSIDHVDVRNQDCNVTLDSSINVDVQARVETDMENTDVPSVPQPDVLTQGAVDVSSLKYNLPSVSDHVYSNTTQPGTMESQQGDTQMQHLSQFSSLLQANTLHNNLMGSNLSPLRDFDFSQLLSTQLATKSNPAVPTTSLPAISMQETLKQGVFSNMQTTQNIPSTSIPSGPPLPQQLSVHPYSQPTLPLGPFSNLVGYPYLPQNYYLPSAAFQQAYSSNGPFHQSAATTAVPGVGMKYSMPQYKSSLPATSPPQPSSVISGFGGFGSSNSIPGNFGVNQNVASAATTMGFDEALSTQFKDNSHYIPLQQNDNSAMWLHGAAGSRVVSAVPPGNFYGFQGQNQQGGFRQGQQPSQYGGLGYPSFYQSQAGLPQEHPQSHTEGTLNSSQTAPSQPSHQIWQHIY